MIRQFNGKYISLGMLGGSLSRWEYEGQLLDLFFVSRNSSREQIKPQKEKGREGKAYNFYSLPIKISPQGGTLVPFQKHSYEFFSRVGRWSMHIINKFCLMQDVCKHFSLKQILIYEATNLKLTCDRHNAGFYLFKPSQREECYLGNQLSADIM